MKRDPESGIRLLDGCVEYRDSSEDRILEILANARDLSSSSDELAGHINDWPSRYHLSTQRANLLRPLEIDSGMRILEVGAGTGVLSRYLGETGADVIALEGQLERARAAAARCRGLDNVEVVAGALESFEDADGFDVVCVVGVLEYAGSDAGGAAWPQAFLDRTAGLLRNGGALVLAIENQIGLKYLLGYSEDHHGLPWIGVEGYPSDDGVRTWSRRGLQALLSKAGFRNTSWFFPFPDYKLPSTVLGEAAYALEDADELVDQLVRRPVRDLAHPQILVSDDRLAHRVLVAAGLGEEIANSLLVVAWAGDEAPPILPPPAAVAWRFGDDRLAPYVRHQVVERAPEGLRIRTISPRVGGDRATPSWLDHEPAKDQPYFRGPTFEQLALAACHRGDRDALVDVLGAWRHFLSDHEELRAVDDRLPHPFLAAEVDSVLPAEFLDVALSNFVSQPDAVHFIDREWRSVGGVDPRITTGRALWLFAQDLVHSGTSHPLPPSLTVRELTIELAKLSGLDVDGALLDAVLQSEVELQSAVTGRNPDELRTDLAWVDRLAQTSDEVVRTLPFTELQRRVESLQSHLAGSEAECAEAGARLTEVSEQLAAAHAKAAAVGEDLEAATSELEAVHAASELLRGELIDTHRKAAEVGGLLEERTAQIEEQQAQLEKQHAQIEEQQAQLEKQHGQLEDTRSRLAATEAELDAMRAANTAAGSEIAQLQGRLQSLEGRWPLKLYRRLQKLLGSN